MLYGKAPQWGEKAYQWDDDFVEVLGIRPEAKVALMEHCGFFARRPFQIKAEFDASHQLSIGLYVFNIRMIRDALTALPSLNWRNPHSGDTLLHWIAKQHPDIMDQLLPLLDHPDVRRRCNNRKGHNAMHIAARYGSYEGLKRFLNYYENDLKQQNNLDLNPIIEKQDSERLACFQLMVDKIHALDPQRINRGVNGEGPPLVVLARDNRLDCLDYLSAKFGPALDLNVTRERQETALHVACIKGHTQFAKRLIELGCDINKPQHQGNTPLMTAAYHGHLDVALLLMKQEGVDLHKQGHQGKSAIFYAAQAGHTAIVGNLYAKGALLEDKNHLGRTPLVIASEEGKPDTVRTLLDLNASLHSLTHAKETPLFLASAKGHQAVVHLLLKRGAAPLQPDEHGMIPLVVAAREGHLKCIQELIPYTSIEKDKELGGWGGTALDVAAKHGHEECYQLLASFGYPHSFYYTSILDRDGLI